ncbi:hypothetical protein F5B22DRAFT_609043 [Xylaria bambusicola]|uniref:uncharacterized protein n=1 Tax=Xylaria bambusicola TaxID=326684 RepID=UPI0020072EDB|nr:uncharacterized protein F5B22DRAFT_609043 [Xylaria bambusicola]KAI0514933.1 hypothetical protein F5B22DRAFT_609043 [Xylaria bambusicola]
MASSLAVSTPSPPGTVHTPGTPKHGYNDPWEPFSPRKSARISSRQQSTNRTPSPRHTYPQSTRSSTKTSTQFSTPATSPIKKRQPAMDSVRRASGTLTAESAANAADSLGISPKSQKKSLGAASNSHSTGMLPTPAKTPRKQPNSKTEAVSRNIARNLFATEEDMLTPRKKAKRYTGLTLDSFRAENVEEDIEIFTDTRDQFPEADQSAENPFYGAHTVAEPSKRRSKRKPVVVPGEGKQSIEDAVKRDDGVLVVFRGKRMFRKFADNDEESSSQAEEDEAVDLDSTGQARRNRPMTRSSIKPRLLFPSAKGKKATTSTVEDEEAVTDIEDNVFNDVEAAEAEPPQTPTQVAKGKVETPDAPRFGPASPPSTGRATRSTDKLRGGDTPMKAKGPSPFDGWRRSKSRAAPQGQKRDGDHIAKPTASAKRQRV